jgi:hypothetical protein
MMPIVSPHSLVFGDKVFASNGSQPYATLSRLGVAPTDYVADTKLDEYHCC